MEQPRSFEIGRGVLRGARRRCATLPPQQAVGRPPCDPYRTWKAEAYHASAGRQLIVAAAGAGERAVCTKWCAQIIGPLVAAALLGACRLRPQRSPLASYVVCD